MNAIHTRMAQSGLVRPSQNRILGGVCAGVARRLGTDPWAVRVLFILALMVLPGSQFLIYPIAWVLMPDESFVPTPGPTPSAPHAPGGTPQDVVR